jgi:hypothetical protein
LATEFLESKVNFALTAFHFNIETFSITIVFLAAGYNEKEFKKDKFKKKRKLLFAVFFNT